MANLNLKENFSHLREAYIKKAMSRRSIRCQSCGIKVTVPEEAVILERRGVDDIPEFALVCSDMCKRRVYKYGIRLARCV